MYQFFLLFVSLFFYHGSTFADKNIYLNGQVEGEEPTWHFKYVEDYMQVASKTLETCGPWMFQDELDKINNISPRQKLKLIDDIRIEALKKSFNPPSDCDIGALNELLKFSEENKELNLAKLISQQNSLSTKRMVEHKKTFEDDFQKAIAPVCFYFLYVGLLYYRKQKSPSNWISKYLLYSVGLPAVIIFYIIKFSIMLKNGGGNYVLTAPSTPRKSSNVERVNIQFQTSDGKWKVISTTHDNDLQKISNEMDNVNLRVSQMSSVTGRLRAVGEDTGNVYDLR